MAQNFFLSCVAAGVLKGGLKMLSHGIPLGPLVLEVGLEVWNRWQGHRKAEQRHAELEQLAKLTVEQMNQQIQEVVTSQAGDRSVAEQRILTCYLRGVQATVRRNLRHPSDPTGTTLPGRLNLTTAEQLVDYLPDRPARFEPGQPIPGQSHWILQEQLGIGGFGEVWLATNTNMPNPSAFKFCLDADLIKSLRNESAQLKRLLATGRQTGIVEMLDVNLDNDPPFLRLEYVAGGELTALIQSWHQQPIGPTPELAARILHQLAQIIAQFHRLEPPLVHRDLKPANILVQAGPDGYEFKIADFGIGGAVAKANIRQATLARGSHPATYSMRGAYTPIYASPEQMRGADPDPRDDVHALGVIWYHVLTGTLDHEVPPDWQDELADRQIHLPPSMLELLKSCLAGKASRRLAHAGLLADQLSHVLALPVPHAKTQSRQLQFQSNPTDLTIPADPIASSTILNTTIPNAIAQTTSNTNTPAVSATANTGALNSPTSSANTAVTLEPPSRRPPPAFVTREEIAPTTAQTNAPRTSATPQAPAEPSRPATPNSQTGSNWSELSEKMRQAPPPSLMNPFSFTQAQQVQEAWSRYLQKPVVQLNSIGMTFILIPPGTFLMGAPYNETGRYVEEAQVRVTLTQPFYIGKFAVTQNEYQSVAGHNPSWFAANDKGRDKVFGKDTRHFPVECVSFGDALHYCRQLTARERDAGLITTAWQYTLPTEAQWEFACRAGSTSRFHFGQDCVSGSTRFLAQLFGQTASANILGVDQSTTPVGVYPANDFQLHDMHGNVWEWCLDWYESRLPGGVDPLVAHPSSGRLDTASRVCRGGSWRSRDRDCRSAYRGFNSPVQQRYNIGFRVVLTPCPTAA